MGEHRKNFEFVDFKRSEPEKFDLGVRKHSFGEIYENFQQPNIREQATRCLSCGNPYCQWKCPLHNYIPDWLELAAEGKFIQAAELAHRTNTLPEVCGRVCPQDRLCEQACTINSDYGAVTIGQIEKFITDNAFAQGWRPDVSGVEKNDFKIAIIGAGPAGLGCADVLVRNGFQVTVYDRYPEIGGLLTFGIPEFKLEKQIMEKRRQIFEEMGIVFKLNTNVGVDISLEEIQNKFDGIFLGLGTYKPVDGGLGDGKKQGVLRALDYLIGNTTQVHQWMLDNHSFINLQDKNVVVLGGGDTAMDCVRTAIRQGAKSVKCVYRKDSKAMPGSKKEYNHAIEEGVEFVWFRQADHVLRNENNEVIGLEVISTIPEHQQAISTTPTDMIECDAIIVAYGFRAEQPKWASPLLIEFDDSDRLIAPERDGFRTGHAKVYAGGDMVRGADLVVTAIADGRKAAESICEDFGVLMIQ